MLTINAINQIHEAWGITTLHPQNIIDNSVRAERLALTIVDNAPVPKKIKSWLLLEMLLIMGGKN